MGLRSLSASRLGIYLQRQIHLDTIALSEGA